MFELVRDTQKLLENSDTNKQTLEAVDDLFSKLGGDVLGIVKDEYSQTDSVDNELMNNLVNVLIEQRKEARNEKNYSRADELRNKLDEIGIVLEDKPEGTTWRIK
jgi:cysteinyl-tRNA synthetase